MFRSFGVGLVEMGEQQRHLRVGDQARLVFARSLLAMIAPWNCPISRSQAGAKRKGTGSICIRHPGIIKTRCPYESLPRGD